MTTEYAKAYLFCNAPLHGKQRKFCSSEHRLAYLLKTGEYTNTCSVCGKPKPTTDRNKCRKCSHGDTPKTNREDVITAYKDGVVCAEIARQVGLSRERVRKIIKSAGLATPTEREGICLNCGRPTPKGQTKFCNRRCSYQYHRKQKPNHRCQICGEPCMNDLCNKHKDFDPWAINRAATLYNEGRCYREVGLIMGFHLITVMRYCHIAGIRPGPGRWHQTKKVA